MPFSTHINETADPRVDTAPDPRVEVSRSKGGVTRSKGGWTRSQYKISQQSQSRRTLCPTTPIVNSNQKSESENTTVSKRGLEELVQSVMDLETGKMLGYRDLLKHPKLGKDWQRSAANEFGRLAQGVGDRIKGTNTIKFIKKENIPSERRKDITYAGFVCKVRPEKPKSPIE